MLLPPNSKGVQVTSAVAAPLTQNPTLRPAPVVSPWAAELPRMRADLIQWLCKVMIRPLDITAGHNQSASPHGFLQFAESLQHDGPGDRCGCNCNPESACRISVSANLNNTDILAVVHS